MFEARRNCGCVRNVDFSWIFECISIFVESRRFLEETFLKIRSNLRVKYQIIRSSGRYGKITENRNKRQLRGNDNRHDNWTADG